MATNENWYILPTSMNQWQTAIIENLARKVPEIPQYIAGVDFNKVDPMIGDADGIMYLTGGIAAIPITIRQGRLAPMDIMVTKNEDFYPVTEAFIQKVFADNVLGEASNVVGSQDDLQQDGPANKIVYYNTVDQVKRASYETKVNLRDAIFKSASLINFFDKNMPDVLSAVVNAEPEAVKEASAEPMGEAPAVHFLANDGDGGYYFNRESITTKEAAELMDAFGLDQEKKAYIMNGGHICIDHREKTSAVVVNEVSVSPKKLSASMLNMATVLTLDGVPHRGYLYDTRMSGARYLFIAPTFHAIQEDIYVLDAQPVEVSEFTKAMTPVEPAMGMFGLVASEWRLKLPGNVAAAHKFGMFTKIHLLNSDSENSDIEVDEANRFYEIPEERRELTKNNNDAMYVVPGRNYSLGLDGEGKLVLDEESLGYVNSVYSLMNKFAMSYEDADMIAEKAFTEGSVKFKLAEFKEDHSKPKKKDDKKSKDEKSSKDSPNEEVPAEEEGAPPQEGDPSQDPSNGGIAQSKQQEAEAAQQQEAEANGAPGGPNGQPGQPMDPAQQELAMEQQQAMATQAMDIKADDLSDIAKINDPTLMDAFLSGKLTDVNTAGREEIMKASDAILGGIKAVGRMLFLIRLGKITTVKEDDAQMALNKMADVARGLGIASSQLI